MTSTLTHEATVRRSSATSLTIALVSAAAFALSGSLGRSLIDLGWSPAATVAVRVGGGCAVLAVPCLVLLRRTGLPTGKQALSLLGYGLVAVAGAQLCFFNAVQHLAVGVALLLEYTAPVLLIVWLWVRRGRRPSRTVLFGAALSILGLLFVLDLRSGLRVDLVGVAWGLGAAVCLCGYFVMSADEGGDPVHPLVLTTVGLGIGAAAIAGVTALGVLPWRTATGTAVLAATDVPWWLPLLLLILVAAAFAYLTGIIAVRRLGSSRASFVALSEVIFAVVFAFVLLGQEPGLLQLVGGVLVLAGIVTVQRGSATPSAATPTAAAPPLEARTGS